MVKIPGSEEHSHLVTALLGFGEVPETTTPKTTIPTPLAEAVAQGLLNGRIVLARMASRRASDGNQPNHMPNLGDAEFKEAFEGILKRLEIDVSVPDPIFWVVLATALLKNTPEFKGKRGRPKNKGGGMDYHRYLAVRKLRQSDSSFSNQTDIALARHLESQSHKLFATYNDATLQASLSTGKRQYLEALEAVEKLLAAEGNQDKNP